MSDPTTVGPVVRQRMSWPHAATCADGPATASGTTADMFGSSCAAGEFSRSSPAPHPPPTGPGEACRAAYRWPRWRGVLTSRATVGVSKSTLVEVRPLSKAQGRHHDTLAGRDWCCATPHHLIDCQL